MKQITIFLLLVMVFCGWSISGLAGDDAGTKLGRGASNLAFGWFEVVNEMGQQSDKHGPLIGVPGGILRGAVFGIGRTLAGALEVVTFLLPNGERGYAPIVMPESVFTRK